MSTSSMQLCISASVVADDDDLLTEILLRLPIKSLLKFKSVSKRWLFFISSPAFSHRRTPYPTTSTALFLRSYPSHYPPLPDSRHFLDAVYLSYPSPCPLFSDSHYFLDLNPNPNATFPSHAVSFSPSGGKIRYFVLNPTTKQYSLLPPIGSTHIEFDSVVIMSLAFDPSKSPHYKVVCLRDSRFSILIYSSDNDQWKRCRTVNKYFAVMAEGVFWNGAVHWFSVCGHCFYLKLDDEQLRELPLPHSTSWVSIDFDRPFWYFGESRDHLHLIEVDLFQPSFKAFDVFEMQRNRSGWYIKYHVDLRPLIDIYPDIVWSRKSPWNPRHSENFCVCSIIRSEADEDSYLVLAIPGKIVRYNFQEKTFHKLYDISPQSKARSKGRSKARVGTKVTRVQHYDVYQYIETLYCV